MIKKIMNYVQWFFGLIFLASLFSIKEAFIFSIVGVILGLMIIPQSRKELMSAIKFPIKKWMVFILGFCLLVLWSSFVPKPTGNPATSFSTPTIIPTKLELVNSPTTLPNQTKKTLYTVTKVVDGDTIQVNIDGKNEVIRLIGVDTPEIVDPRTPVQCYAKEASDFTKSTLTNKTVALEYDSSQGDKDKYNRLLRYVFLENDTNFNLQLIKDGYAHEYTYFLPYKYQKEFKEAELFAQNNRVGLWQKNICITPTIAITKTPIQSPSPIAEDVIESAVETTSFSQTKTTTPGFSCSVSKTKCGDMSSCAEATFYLTSCGVSRLDGDHDGTPCETLCN